MAKRSAKLRAWPADSIERWPLAKIVPYERNPRLHSEEQITQIAASMKRFGVTTPVLVDEDGELIYGHGRLAAAKLLGLREFPVAVARGWSEAEKRAYRIADNQLALNSTWNDQLLQAEVVALASFDDIRLLGFSDDELAILRDGWSSDIDVLEKYGSNTDGITATIFVDVKQADAERTKDVIGKALTRAHVEHELR